MELSAARLFVRDLAQAQHFYGTLLGLPLLAGGTELGFCVFGPSSVQLVVEPVPLDAPPEEQALVGRFSGLSFAVTSIADEYTRLQACGVTFTGAPEVQHWGGVLATLRDPSGNQVQLVQRPKPGQDLA